MREEHLYYLCLYTTPQVTWVGPFSRAVEARTLNEKLIRPGHVVETHKEIIASKVVPPLEFKEGVR